jgi:hypothetical protein
MTCCKKDSSLYKHVKRNHCSLKFEMKVDLARHMPPALYGCWYVPYPVQHIKNAVICRLLDTALYYAVKVFFKESPAVVILLFSFHRSFICCNYLCLSVICSCSADLQFHL